MAADIYEGPACTICGNRFRYQSNKGCIPCSRRRARRAAARRDPVQWKRAMRDYHARRKQTEEADSQPLLTNS